jgi:hypothetical protein
MSNPPVPRPQLRIVHPWPDERVRVLDLSPSGVHIEHQMHLNPGTDCTLELPVEAGAMARVGTVIRCTWLMGRNLPFWYESEIEFRAA